MAEKRTAQLPPVRTTETLEIALMRLASRDGRSLSDYINRVLTLHAFGHAESVADPCTTCQHSNASQCDARS